jgi:hypothetical protein
MELQKGPARLSPDLLTKLQGAAKAAQGVLEESSRQAAQLKPYYYRIDVLNQELARTHATIQSKVASGHHILDDMKSLETLRHSLLLSLDDFAEKVHTHEDDRSKKPLHDEPGAQRVGPDSTPGNAL